MKINEYINKDGKKLRMGYTTGSCATAASKAAAIMLLTQRSVDSLYLITPKGIEINLDIEDIDIAKDYVSCAVKKDSGDDPDVTNGILVYAKVSLLDKPEIIIDGGKGIGRVTKPGLNQPVGNAAINSTPRQTITKELMSVADDYNYKGGFSVIISAPQGEEISKRTYNSRLGILGGISIIGTSGIVEPMSDSAIVDTIKAELSVRLNENKKCLLITPGNYGEDFLKEDFRGIADVAVKCSNFIGDTLEYAEELGFKRALLVGHIGKIVKLAGGLFNTHSKYGDCRAEIIAAHSALYGADREITEHILNSVTTDEMLDKLRAAGLLNKVMDSIMDKIKYLANLKTHNTVEVGVICFSQVYGQLGMTDNALKILEEIKGEI